jgi:hypothetical protein
LIGVHCYRSPLPDVVFDPNASARFACHASRDFFADVTATMQIDRERDYAAPRNTTSAKKRGC